MKRISIISVVGVLFVLFIAGCGDDVKVSGGGSGAVAVQGQDASTTPMNPIIVSGGDAGEGANASNGNGASDNFVQLDADSLPTILFGFDKYTIGEDMLPNIEKVANALKQSGAKVVLEGNTDSFGSDEYNFALGKKRADSVRNALEIRGVNPSNLSTVTYGESKPVCTQATQECYKANRRVDFKLAQ